jgi:hypothetical protein
VKALALYLSIVALVVIAVIFTRLLFGADPEE